MCHRDARASQLTAVLGSYDTSPKLDVHSIVAVLGITWIVVEISSTARGTRAGSKAVSACAQASSRSTSKNVGTTWGGG